jgi:dolichol kinase
MNLNTVGRLLRKLWHFCGGSIAPIGALFFSTNLVIDCICIATAIILFIETLRFSIPHFNQQFISRFAIVLKREEKSWLTGTTYLLLSTLFAFLLFDKQIAITSLLFLSIGDPLAAVIGRRFGEIKIFNKSLEGSLACLISCLAIGVPLNIFILNLSPGVVFVGAVVATLTELLSLPVDDNFTIPLLSGAAMALACLLYF